MQQYTIVSILRVLVAPPGVRLMICEIESLARGRATISRPRLRAGITSRRPAFHVRRDADCNRFQMRINTLKPSLRPRRGCGGGEGRRKGWKRRTKIARRRTQTKRGASFGWGGWGGVVPGISKPGDVGGVPSQRGVIMNGRAHSQLPVQSKKDVFTTLSSSSNLWLI